MVSEDEDDWMRGDNENEWDDDSERDEFGFLQDDY